MPIRTVIALDGMGGDHAPGAVLDGAVIALPRFPGLYYHLYGDRARLEPLLAARPALRGCCDIFHTPDAISPDAKPSHALRQGRQSSMRLAINAVAEGTAQGIVSAGNTGALMAIAKFVLKTLPGIDRPAIASFFPTERGESVLLDLGANVECDAENLVQFALMGTLFARIILAIEEPTIGLLNIGAEEMKGHDELRTAASILRGTQLPGRFHGFVEGDDIPAGTTDVVVTDGFSGNIALKTAEGTARLIAGLLRQTGRSSLLAMLGFLLAGGAFRRLRARLDPRKYNGAMLLGLQGVCVKSHGGTDGEGFANAIGVAVDMVRGDFNERIRLELEKHGGTLMALDAAPVEGS